MAYPGKPERNRKMFADYRGGLTREQLAEKYGLKIGTVHGILYRNGVTLPKGEANRRLQSARSKFCGGRPPVWPDCPPNLQREYMRLRYSHGIRAAEARKLLEAGL